MGRWLWENVGTLLLALVLAVLVWIVAVNEENPTEERTFAEPVVVELRNLPPDLIRVGIVMTETTITIRAPRSTWEILGADQIHVWANLASVVPGSQEVTLEWQLDEPTARVTKLNPASIRLSLETRAARELPIQLEQTGEPAPGYEAGKPDLSATTAVVTGPSSAVDRVSEIVAAVSLANLKSDLNKEVTLVPVDASGKSLPDVTLSPLTTQVSLPVTQKAGFRDVAVSPIITGQVALGYRVTNITVAPLVITVSSADPGQVNKLPGFVETQPLDIGGASDDIAQRLALALPEGVAPVGEQSVLVQVNIAAIESSLTVQRPLEIQGLGPGLFAASSPEMVDVLLSGPLPVLDQLKPEDVRVILDLTDLKPGAHQVTPQVVVLPQKLRAENVLPGQIEVVISLGSTPTLTSTATTTPTATRTARPTPRPTLTPSATPTPTSTPASP